MWLRPMVIVLLTLLDLGVIGIFGCDDVSEQPRARNSFVDGLRGHLGFGVGFALLTDVFLAGVGVDEERSGAGIELLGNLFADIQSRHSTPRTRFLGFR